MPEHLDFDSFLPALRALSAFLDELGFPSAIVGGVAFGIQAVPRATKDIDALVIDDLLQVEHLVALASKHGIEPRTPESIHRAKQERVLTLRHSETDVPVDLLIGMFPFERETAQRAQKMSLEGILLTVCSPEDLIVLKAFAGRLQDLADIDRLLETREDVDRIYVERKLKELSSQLDAPEIWSRVESLPAWNH